MIFLAPCQIKQKRTYRIKGSGAFLGTKIKRDHKFWTYIFNNWQNKQHYLFKSWYLGVKFKFKKAKNSNFVLNYDFKWFYAFLSLNASLFYD